MAVAKIQLGQIWLLEGTSEQWLVTKVYSEAFTSYAMLRKTGGTTDEVRRVKVEKSSDGVSLAGFKFAQDSGEF